MCHRDCTKVAIGKMFFHGNDRRSLKKREGLFGRSKGHYSDTDGFTYTEPWACCTTPSAIVDCSRQRGRCEVSSYIEYRERATMQDFKKKYPQSWQVGARDVKYILLYFNVYWKNKQRHSISALPVRTFIRLE